MEQEGYEGIFLLFNLDTVVKICFHTSIVTCNNSNSSMEEHRAVGRLEWCPSALNSYSLMKTNHLFLSSNWL